MNQSNNKSLEKLSLEIASRGNDVEIRRSKDGLKIFEVSKRLVKIIPNGAFAPNTAE